ncbi:MAG TPA: DUF2989 domain-containing protein, partial [Idiomarina loihiensis]|nr:DUF2989 domain-containing protein [Idiomarina loihiensis]
MLISMFKKIVITSAVLALTGCMEGKPSVSEICESTPGICSDLNTDNWCSVERSKLIYSRYDRSLNDTNENQYFVMRDLEEYSKCIELAATLEMTKSKEKQSERLEAFINSRKNIEKLADETTDSEHPLWLYWHWANRSDQGALDKLLALEGTKKMETPELKLALATY